MTHEQKPESAEFRAREEQNVALADDLLDVNSCTYVMDFEKVGLHLKEAEARGAAEQRRQDAEGVKPVAYRWRVENMPGFHTPWSLQDFHPFPDGTRENEVVEELYIRLANVAALEARVKELKGEVERWIAEAVAAEREKIAGKLDEVAKHLARPWGSYLTEEGIAVKEACAARVEQEAAAIREGGEHG